MACTKCSQDIKNWISPDGTPFDGCDCTYDNTGRVITGRSNQLGQGLLADPCLSCVNDPTGRVFLGRSSPANIVPMQQTYYQRPMLSPQPQKLAFDWGSFVGGVVIGGIVAVLLVTATGRGLLGAAGQRTTSYIRGK